MKRGKHLKIANPENADIECQPDYQKIDITKEKQTAFYSALLEAWLSTKMEKDKSLLMLSAGGVGILVTLLTTTGIHSRSVGILFAIAMGCFLASIILAVLIFGRNANYIHCLINDKPAKDRDLKWMDRIMFWSFIFGILLSIFIGLFSGIIRFQNQEATMNKDTQINNNQTPSIEKRSYSGLSELRPTDSPSPGQGQQSGESNQGGSSESNQSSESSQSSGSQNANND